MAVLASKDTRKGAPSTSSSLQPPTSTPTNESRKRPYPQLSGPAGQPKKVVKLSGEERIQELEAQVRELHKFILDMDIADGLYNYHLLNPVKTHD
jgi:hypothetical protein